MGKHGLSARLEQKIEIQSNNCWYWTSSIHPSGYGYVSWKGKSRLVHRIVYELLVEPIPEGLQIDHLCRVRHCVNPEHMEPVTHKVNAERGYFATRTHCKHGHPYNEKNTLVGPFGDRICRTCNRAATKRHYQRTIS